MEAEASSSGLAPGEAWRALLPSALLMAAAVLLLETRTVLLLLPAAAVLPLAALALMRTLSPEDPEDDMRREAPELVALMSVALHGGGNLHGAMRFVAEAEGLRSARHFRRLLWSAETRRCAGPKDALDREPAFRGGGPLAVAMQLLVAASEGPPGTERTELVEEANRISIDGMRSALDRYASSLGVPAMTVFAAGIILPLICVSLLPLMMMGQGMGGGAGYGPLVLAGVLGLPFVVALYMRRVLARSPALSRARAGALPLLPFLAVIAAAIALFIVGTTPATALLAAALPLCALTALATRKEVAAERRRGIAEEELGGNLVRLGNGLRSGRGLEDSLRHSLPDGEASSAAVRGLLHSMRAGRSSTAEAVGSALEGMSPSTVATYQALFRAARKDMAQAGELCIRMGRHLHQRRVSREDVMNRMRSLTDMMSGTSLLFAPLVLGIGLSLASPLAVGGPEGGWTLLLTGLYLVELAVLTSWIGARLNGEEGMTCVAHNAALRSPVALMVFLLSWQTLSGGLLSL